MHAIIVKLPDFAPDNEYIKVKSFAGTSWFRPVGHSLDENVGQAVKDHLEHTLAPLLGGEGTVFGLTRGELPDGSGYAYIVEVL